MEKSKIKEILIKEKERHSTDFKVKNLKRAYRYILRLTKKDKESVNSKWLYENFYLLDEIKSEALKTGRFKRLHYIMSLLVPLIEESKTEDIVSAFFEVLGEDFSDSELECVKGAMLFETVLLIKERAENGGEVSTYINFIRELSAFDFSPYLLGYVTFEQYLRRDGVYQRLDRESKALYKDKIKRYAKKRGLSFQNACEELIKRGEKESCHFGKFLEFNKPKRYWSIVYILLFAFFVYLSFVLIFPLSFFIFLLSLLPLREAAFHIYTVIVSKFEKSEILPRLDMSKVDTDNSALTVITALAGDSTEIKRLFSHLERISLKSEKRGSLEDSLYYAVLLDLPESDTKIGKKDLSIIRTAKSEIDRLEKRYPNRFLFYFRDRVKDKTTGKFVPFERKRGAINELVKHLSGMPSVLQSYGADLPEIRYVLTLDADTDIELGAVNKMIGTLAHPNNKPTVTLTNGVKVVSDGFGILQPTIATLFESAHTTRFSSIMAGAGGINTYHSTVFNLSHILHGKGIFSGKGMFDLKAYREVILNAFPDGCVLSHDMLEGTRLSAGYVSDVVFFESIPSNVISYYKRAHRWARGDVQNLRFLTKRVPTLRGEVLNPMPNYEKSVFLGNVLNLITPIFQVLSVILLMGEKGDRANLAVLLFLLPTFIPIVIELFSHRMRTALRKFFTDTFTALSREAVMTGYRLSSLFFTAYNSADAVIRSLWRMAVSKKKLLEWTTASQSEKRKSEFSSVFIFTLPSFIVGIFLLLFSALSAARLMGILWVLFPFISYFISRKREKRKKRGEYSALFERYARDIWRYFDKYADVANNFLPPDNVSVFPSSEVAMRTSPTNIGLFLNSVLSALDFGFIDVKKAVDKIERAFDSIEKLPKYRGQLYNWYSTLTLEVIGEEYISTVDCGNFVASLVPLYEGLKEHEKEDIRIPTLLKRIKTVEENSDFRFLYNSQRNLFSLGYFPEKKKQDGIVYDMYMSEARTTDYYAIARGIVKSSHWGMLNRPIKASSYSVGALSWSGTVFEYFMPHLYLPIYKNSFAHESLAYAYAEEIKYSAITDKGRVFGISESGYFHFDGELNYQYKAFGVPTLSRKGADESDKVISPYSSFLMLRMNTSAVLKNLRTLERLGMYGGCGFYEALDFNSKRVGKSPALVKSFMCHHLGMSLIALANANFDDIFVRRFMRDSQMSAVSDLLKEAVPADAVSLKRKKRKREYFFTKRREERKEERVFRTGRGTGVLSGREHSMVVFERGVAREEVRVHNNKTVLAHKPVSPYNPTGLIMFSTEKGRVTSPAFSNDTSFLFDSVSAEWRSGTLSVKVGLSAKTGATRIHLKERGEEGEVGVYFEPLLTSLDAYLSHPAYAGLFFKAEYDESASALILTYSGQESVSLAVVCTLPYTFEVSKLKLFNSQEFSPYTLKKALTKELSRSLNTKTLLSPAVLIKSRYTSKADTTFIIGYGRTRSEALYSAVEEKRTSLHKSLTKAYELYSSALSAAGIDTKFDRELFELLVSGCRPEYNYKIRDKFSPDYKREYLFSLGLSGDNPIVLVKASVKSESLKKIIKYKKLTFIMGVRFDLVIEVSESGYLRGQRGEIEAIIESVSAGFLIGKRGGIFLVDISRRGISEALFSLAKAVYPERESLTLSYPLPYFENSVTQKTGENEYTKDSYEIKKEPEVLWSHIIASQTFGTILNHRSLGYTWVFNSRLSRLSYFENDAVGGSVSEKIYFKDKSGIKDLCLSAKSTRFLSGIAEYFGDTYSLKVAIHPTLLFKAVKVKTEGENFSLKYSFLPVMDDYPHACTVIEYFLEKNAYFFKNIFSSEFNKGFGYIYMPYEKSVKVGEGYAEVTSSKSGEFLFVFGYAGSERHFEEVRKFFTYYSFEELCDISKAALDTKVLKGSVKSRYAQNFSDFWLPYQILVSRFYARSGPYQSGGAWGFRDQAQDALSVIDMDEKLVRNHIFRLARHQYLEGDVQHWWHFKKGVRTRCSDDYLWLIVLSAFYIQKTGDRSILDKEIYYLDSKTLSPKERDRYEESERSKVKETLSMHLERALDLAVKRGLGEHSIPLILSGDWNDAMDTFPEGSESVWLGFFMRIVIHLYTKVIKEDERYIDFSEKIREGIENNAFFSDRYARVLLPDGRVIGVEESEVKIDALPQAFASICHALTGDGNTRRISLALDSSWRYLFDREKGIFKLFTPPFSEYRSDIGYITRYPEGIRENGGQYTHAAVWSAIGFLLAPEKKEENLKRSKELAALFNPLMRKEDYKTEPYVMTGDIYSNSDNPARGGWSWYSGSASWYRLLLLLLENWNNSDSPS